MILRVAKEQTVFLYQLLEGYDGIANFSTMPFERGQGYRDIEIFVTNQQKEEFLRVLENLQKEIPLIVM